MPTQPAAAQDLIPRPAHYAAAEGRFRFTAGTGMACDQLPDSLRAEALRFVALVGRTCGLPLSTTTDTAAAIVCRTASAGTASHDDPACRPEGYRLDVTPRRITVTASTATGFFYAFQTLARLMPPHVAAGRHNPQAPASVPACHIADAPRFAYRGFMLDVSRHFFGVDEVKRMLDVMASYKMNRFHWHLTNDQGWRLEIKKYPRLTTVGAERQGSWNVDPTYGLYFDYDRYGPAYYTQEQVRDIVAYARERHIEIIPEIEFPGHCAAAMTAYPEFSCDPYGPHRLWSDGDIASRDGDLLNVADTAALRFVKDILDEVADLFPYPYIHIGGDECPTHGWERNDACRALMDSLGLNHPRALQSRFTHELARHMATQRDPSRRRRLIAWNETLTAPGTDVGLVRGDSLTIMCWVRSGQAVNAAESLGLPTIVTPQPTYYINRRQNPMEGEVFNAGRGTDCTLQTVYEHRPAVGRHTVGIQGTFWSTYVSSDYLLEYQALPRLIAVAEAAWTPDSLRHFPDFVRRLRLDTARLSLGGYAFARHFIDPAFRPPRFVPRGRSARPETGKTYRIVSASPRWHGTRLTDDGRPILGHSASDEAADLWRISLRTDPDGHEEIALTHAATGRCVADTASPLRMGEKPVWFRLVHDAEQDAYTFATPGGALAHPVGHGYRVDAGTLRMSHGARVPQGTHFRFVEAVPVTYTARDERGRLLGRYSRSAAVGQPYRPMPPRIDQYACLTAASLPDSVNDVSQPLNYDLTYRRQTYTVRLRSVDPHGVLIREERHPVPAARCARFRWQAPQLPDCSFVRASATPRLRLRGDTVVTLHYATTAPPTFAEALADVDTLVDGHYYVIFHHAFGNDWDNTSGYLNLSPADDTLRLSDVTSGPSTYVWRAMRTAGGFRLEATDGRYVPAPADSAHMKASPEGTAYVFRHDGLDWTIQAPDGLYLNGLPGYLTGSAVPGRFRIREFRTEAR